jgi:predicted tellurium resistance membrane protein TerC
MKNENLLLKTCIGGCMLFVLFISISLLFQKWNLFDFNNRSLKNIIIEALIVSAVYALIMFFYAKRLRERKRIKS